MPKAIDHDQRRTEIIDVTWRLIVKGGLEAATMRQIAAEAGFANGALKHYFPGKDEIITGAYQRAIGLIAQRVQDATDGRSGLDALHAAVWASMPLDAESREAARVLLVFWEQGMSSRTISESYRGHLESWHGALEDLVAACRAAGTIRTPTPDAEIVDELILLNVGSTLLSAVSGDFLRPASLERVLDALFERLRQPAQLSAAASAP